MSRTKPRKMLVVIYLKSRVRWRSSNKRLMCSRKLPIRKLKPKTTMISSLMISMREERSLEITETSSSKRKKNWETTTTEVLSFIRSSNTSSRTSSGWQICRISKFIGKRTRKEEIESTKRDKKESKRNGKKERRERTRRSKERRKRKTGKLKIKRFRKSRQDKRKSIIWSRFNHQSLTMLLDLTQCLIRLVNVRLSWSSANHTWTRTVNQLFKKKPKKNKVQENPRGSIRNLIKLLRKVPFSFIALVKEKPILVSTRVRKERKVISNLPKKKDCLISNWSINSTSWKSLHLLTKKTFQKPSMISKNWKKLWSIGERLFNAKTRLNWSEIQERSPKKMTSGSKLKRKRSSSKMRSKSLKVMMLPRRQTWSLTSLRLPKWLTEKTRLKRFGIMILMMKVMKSKFTPLKILKKLTMANLKRRAEEPSPPRLLMKVLFLMINTTRSLRNLTSQVRINSKISWKLMSNSQLWTMKTKMMKVMMRIPKRHLMVKFPTELRFVKRSRYMTLSIESVNL